MVGIELTERRRPIAAVIRQTIVGSICQEARSGKEDGVAVRGGELAAFHAVQLYPLAFGVFQQFLELGLRRHPPSAAPVGCGGIVVGLEGFQFVSEALVAARFFVTILRQIVISAFAPLVVTPRIAQRRIIIQEVFLRGLAPREVVAEVLGIRRAHVAGCPKQSARQSKIDVLMSVDDVGVLRSIRRRYREEGEH